MKLLSLLFNTHHSKTIITVGFCLVFLLITGVMFVSFKQLARLEDKQHLIEQNSGRKESLLSSMNNIIRERTFSMFAISRLQDPFDKDEEFMRFKAMAGRFIKQRDMLESMPLSGAERHLLEQSKVIVMNMEPLQEQIVEGLLYGGGVDVQQFIENDLPMKSELLSILSEMDDVARQARDESIRQVHMDYQHTYWSIIMLGMAALLICIMIIRFVIDRIGSAEDVLSSEKEQLEVTLKSIGDAVITVDEHSVVTYLNPVAEHMLVCSNQQAQGRPLAEIYQTVREDTGEPIQHPAWASQLDAQVVGMHRYSVLKTHDGREYIIEDNSSPIFNKQNRLIGKVVVFRDMTHARKIERQLSWQVRHDSLTGLANRLEFETHLQEFVDNATRYDNEHILLYLDLDEFKAVNDISGHSAGDTLLQKISAEMEQCVRRSDVFARLGGDEFGVLLNSCDMQQGRDIAETIRRKVNNFRFDWQDAGHRVGISIGMVSINTHSGTPADVLHAADIACYNAKAYGKNRIWSYDQYIGELVPVYLKHQ